MVFQAWTVILVGLAYVGLLFAVATWGDKLAAKRNNQRRPRPFIYALSLGVYCTSWTYFGSVGVSSRTGYDFIPVYLGPILVFALGWPLLSRIVMIAKAQNIASIADFISARYGKNEALGALVAVIAVIGIVPYISIQLKALSFSLGAMIQTNAWPAVGGNLALMVTIALAVFAILFGTRHIDTTEHQDGMILAIALESVVKLAAFIAVGLFVTYSLAGGPMALLEIAQKSENISTIFSTAPAGGRWITVALLSACAIVLLPRQFHVTVVENAHGSDVRRAAWMFPLYLIAINLFVAPIAIMGLANLPNLDADTYVLALPVAAQSEWITLIAFVGGISAATAMVIVETIALSIMVSNNLVVPLILLRQGEQNMFQRSAAGDRSTALITIRRTAICCILLFAYGYYWLAGNAAAIAQIGLISFAAVAQFAPAFFGGLVWRRGTARGAGAGIFMGFCVWAYTLLIPSFIDSGWLHPAILSDGPFGIAALRPRQLLGLEFDPLTHGVLWSLLINLSTFLAVSATRPPSRIEALQADAFIPQGSTTASPTGYRLWRSSVTVGQVEDAVARYLGQERTREAFSRMVRTRDLADDPRMEADVGVLNFGEHLLASAIGPASSRLVMALLLERHAKGSRDALQLLDDASSAIEHNRTVLQSAINNVPLGLVVYDAAGELMSWNSAYSDVLGVDDQQLFVGKPIEEMLNLLRDHDVSNMLSRRDQLYAATEPFRARLDILPRVLDFMSGKLPDGGIVITISDVTESVAAADRLQEANETLEQRVDERTAELKKLNGELARAKADADAANQGKTRFIAAASHDILQPLNAARLFTSALVENAGALTDKNTVRNVDAALEAVEDILSTVLDISRLDAGAIKPEVTSFAVQDMFDVLQREFAAAASDKGLVIKFVHSRAVIKSDRKLLRRILQNLISNAIKYTHQGRVLVGVRRHENALAICVFDTGLGIPLEQQKLVFREFERLGRDRQNAPGLGLGLSIVERMCKVLRHPLSIVSAPGAGTRFSVVVPVGREALKNDINQVASATPPQLLSGMCVLAVDNEPAIVEGLALLLRGWNVTVLGTTTAAGALQLLNENAHRIDAVLADYHIDGDDGLDLIAEMRRVSTSQLPAVLITADRSKPLQDAAAAAQVQYLSKPVKPAALRACLARVAQHRAIAAE